MLRISFYITAASTLLFPAQAKELHVRLPDFIERQRGYDNLLKMHQEIEIVGSNLKICRNILNVSVAGLSMDHVPPTGDGSGQFFTFFISHKGEIIPGKGETMLVPPPPPPLGGGEAKTDIPSGGRLENCKLLTVDSKLGSVFIVSIFSPGAITQYGKLNNDSVNLHSGRSLISNTCRVNFRKSSVRC